ncbi:MAG TPA: hypothetical protein VMB85_12240 [Bryobacteraceae bacterium]|nr:hypothetical protein [Bryobacteraceae bacterium]
MKLRFHSNTLRIRLSQSEVARLGEAGRVEETVVFPAGRSLAFAVELRPSREIAASFDGERIEIAVPADLGRTWIASDQPGIENPDATPKILIEKDFQCLHQNPVANPDAFPNPLMDKF